MDWPSVIKSVYVKPLKTTFVVQGTGFSDVLSPANRKHYKSVLADRIDRRQKNGEMALVMWIEIYTSPDAVVEVRESDCVLFSVNEAER